MNVLHECCAGLDIHKETVAACALWIGEGGECREEVATFGTMTRDLLALSDWLAARKVTHVAMEATGVYWKPVFNVLEECFEVVLVNARHIKQVPGRKSDPQQTADLAVGRLKKKREALAAALEGHVTEHHRFMLRALWEHLQYLEGAIGRMDERIEELMRPFVQEIERLDQIPGVDVVVAHGILAEIGPNMTVFPSPAHLASWAGLCPGNNESAGKRKSGRTTKGSRWLRSCLCQAAWAASRTKNTYLSAQFRQIARRRGVKRAIIAVAHSILVMTYHMLRAKVAYKDLGPEHFDRLQPERLKRYYVSRLRNLGYEVTLADASVA